MGQSGEGSVNLVLDKCYFLIHRTEGFKKKKFFLSFHLFPVASLFAKRHWGEQKGQGSETSGPGGGTATGKESSQSTLSWGAGPSSASRRGGGHARCLSQLTWPLPRGIQAKLAVASGGEGAEALPQPGGRALSAGRRAGRRQICLFVCLWRRSLCALKSPLESRGQTSPSGEVVFVLLCKLEFSCGSHQNI